MEKKGEGGVEMALCVVVGSVAERKARRRRRFYWVVNSIYRKPSGLLGFLGYWTGPVDLV